MEQFIATSIVVNNKLEKVPTPSSIVKITDKNQLLFILTKNLFNQAFKKHLLLITLITNCFNNLVILDNEENYGRK